MLYARNLQPAEKFSTSLPAQSKAELLALLPEITALTKKLLDLDTRLRRGLNGVSPDKAVSRISSLIDAASMLSNTLKRCR
jgi:hypothetical protein